jgi:hypothetical protein
MDNVPGRRFLSGCFCCSSGRDAATDLSRRTVLSGMAAVGVGASASIIARASPALAQAASVSKPALIDVHHHFVPPTYLAENRDRIAGARGQVSPPWLEWTSQKALDAMDA